VAYLAGTLVLVFAASSSAHEPITTKVRFNKEVIRVLQKNCLVCHHTGGIAMSLATWEEARPWAKAIKEELLEKRMPPWRAVRGYGEFANAPAITQRDIDMIVNWVEGGAPKGDEKDLPAPPLYSNDWALGKPDLVIKPDAEAKVGAGADEYRAFTLDVPAGVRPERWLTALDLRPSNASVVHCATISVQQRESEAPKLLSTWRPGQIPVALRAPAAQLLPAGSKLVLRVHYRGTEEAAADRSELGLYFSKAPSPKSLQELIVTGRALVLPAGAARYRVSALITVESDLEAIALRPLVHPLMFSVQATAYRPDGTQEVLIWSRGYQFHWQDAYYFKRPVALPKGTRIEVIAYFDNSDDNRHNPNDPAKTLRWSELGGAPLFSVLAATRDSTE
jgi:hypothetical protein